ncbi:MAG: acetate--CoA ligase family protein [Candidatus Eiseniibacteriota bacterium]|nr:MAG: acetate--CoA ligase family protein [Candidatus Eisenbacteria bacterium]
MGGYKCFKSILDVPGPVDLALIAVNYKLVLPALRDCVKKGVKFATVFSSGFAEAGEEGKALQEEMAKLARESGMGVCGPNCQGSVNLKESAIGGFSASLGMRPFRIGPIGYVTQSGALGYSLFSLALEAGVGFTHVASTGNEVDLHTLDFMEHILEDPDTRMIISYLEGIKDGRQFARIADRALELGKPIVTLKVGRSEVGQKAASSHTASLTGSDAVCDAFFRQKGIIRVPDIEAMIDVAALMQHIPALPEGTGLGIITTSGGGGILVADEAVDLGLDIPELDPATKEAVKKVIPEYGSALNPIDVTAQVINEAEGFMHVLEAVAKLPQIHAFVIVVTQITGEQGMQMAQDIAKMSGRIKKPITVAWTTADQLVGGQLKALSDGGVQYYKSPVRAVRAMGALMKYAAFRKEHLESVLEAREEREVVPEAAQKAVAPQAKLMRERKAAQDKARALLSSTGASLTEHQGKQLLSLYGIPVTQEEVAASEKDAVRIADGIGYPVAMKIDSPDILHKTEAGGLKLGISSAEEVPAVFGEIMQNARKYKSDAKVNGVLVQEMVRDGTEVIVGVKNDPQFGPMILFGLGGIFVEILKDVSLRVAPITRQAALDMIKDIKGFSVLAGARGRPKADIDAIADVLIKVSRLALELEDSIAELDINPLIVLPEGQGASVADALVIKR